MSNYSPYPEIDSLISEYDELIDKLSSETKNLYPRIFTLAVASYFEKKIITLMEDYLQNYNSFPNGARLNASKAYKRFYTEPNLDATEFYKLFQGWSSSNGDFKTSLICNFNSLKTQYIQQLNEKMDLYSNIDDKIAENAWDNLYIILDILQNVSFTTAELSFLELKKCRNSIAHYFFVPLNITYIQQRDYFYQAMLYVKALEDLLVTMI